MIFPKVIERPVLQTGLDAEEMPLLAQIQNYKALVDPDTDHVYAVVAQNYRLTRHEEMLQVVQDVVEHSPEFGKVELNVQCFDQGAKMRANLVFPEIDHYIGGKEKGDLVHPQIELLNSYDTGWSRKIYFGAYRVVCTNGLTIGERLFVFQRKHSGIFDEQEVKKQLTMAMEKYSNQTKIWEKWVDKVTTPAEYIEVMEALPLGKKEIAAIGDEVEIASNLRLADIRTKTLSFWLFYNILCQYITHRVKSHMRQIELNAAMRTAFRNRI